jgi:hypothetical protein
MLIQWLDQCNIPQVTKYCYSDTYESQALVSFKKYMPPPLPYFKVVTNNIKQSLVYIKNHA